MNGRATTIRQLAALLAFLLALTGCTNNPGSPFAPTPPPDVRELAAKLANALSTGTVGGLPLTGNAEQAETDYQQAMSTMSGLLPEVAVGDIVYDGRQTADVQLVQRYAFPQSSFEFTSTAVLRQIDDDWRLQWTPTIVHPDLDATSRLFYERTPAKRGSILDAAGAAIVEDRAVYRVGIDKTRVTAEQTDASARALAGLVGIEADSYAQLVADSGPQAFVLAITLREGTVPPAIEQIPGAAAFVDTLPLAPTATFARGILGVAGEATAEVIEASDGAIQLGDIVGLSGLQKIHDEQLRGLPGHSITAIRRSDTQLAKLAPESSSPASPSTESGTPATPKPPNRVLFTVDPVAGEPLRLTMELALQHRAEEVLAGYSTLVMVAVLDRQTGAILAAASSPPAGAQSFVTTGRYPPGSTMKVATSLALLRRGYTPDSIVDCSPTAEVNGRVFTNYPGYPDAFTGQISLRTALQQSCNTAFMNAAAGLGPTELHDAAASLGIGVDFETGFDAFYGSVEPSDDPVVRAAAAIGQGNVLMSPMALAAEAASVGSGHTVVPYLLAGQAPTPTAAALTESEAASLRDMMGAVIAGGTLAGLQGVLEGGKSGTAEYTDDVPPKSHGWTIGFAGRYAICVMDYEHTGPPLQDVVRALLT
ncbi:MAG: penicillin-binding transpeptidase domain-containing protein [Acidobacteriota bacterium]|nr:penicillin-binding transpeptidase domain-containing protein [Acidobacteriota bacterium]